ncbi:hypothetical protein NEOLEDRAFT_1240771 [Neolentinus lepideus HHB14362 ss-1]|uniref:Uncharacterized protein n=1 Tax=Neolentinus lepideus HHB14362 ss-1 TaxID=1314782 RepID=A0A165TI76_9AGAM|nr:hypothetical protein NEOLEDRAFT_1240771 [Neolentinus lepideus HHB14362 ss-1]
MILLDEEDQQQRKLRPSSVAGPTSRIQEDSVPGRDPLPDYETSQALQENEIVTVKTRKKRRKCWCCVFDFKSDARFWRATLYALMIYILITIAVGVPLVVLRVREQREKKPFGLPWGDDSASELLALPISDGQVVDCNTWQSNGDGQQARLEYKFPVSSSIVMKSNVTQDMDAPRTVRGNLLVDLNSDHSEDETLVFVNLNYSSDRLLDATNVCHIKGLGSDGVSISIPGNLTGSDSLYFNMTVLLPSSSNSTDSINIDQLVTFLPSFSQQLGSLYPAVRFTKTTIEGPMSAITVGSLQADAVVMKTSLAPIVGTFNASDSLILDTMAAPINANITLTNPRKCGRPTILDISTGNSGLTANITLSTPAPPTTTSNLPPQFLSEVTTFSGNLNLSIVHDSTTPPTHMHLRCQNNLGLSSVTLDEKFEGTFSVQTKFDEALLLGYDAARIADPLDPSRQRTFQLDYNTTSRMDGWVGWGARPNVKWSRRTGQGRVEVITSLSPVSLDLGGR